MSTEPEDVLTEEQQAQKDLNDWYELSAQLEKIKAAEMVARMTVFNRCFPHAVEGTNKLSLGNGWELNATYPITRKVDVAMLTAQANHLREDLKIPLDDVIVQKPELSVSAYRKLTEDQRREFDLVLTVKPGSPQMKLVQPKRAAAAGLAPQE